MNAAETLKRLLNTDWSGREPMFYFCKSTVCEPVGARCGKTVVGEKILPKISEFFRLDIRKEAVQMPRKKLLRGKDGGRNDALLVYMTATDSRTSTRGSKAATAGARHTTTCRRIWRFTSGGGHLK